MAPRRGGREGVVGGGDPRPGGGAVGAGQEGARGGRHHPGGEDVPAGAEDAGDQGALQQDPRGAGVAADDHGRAGRPGGGRTGRGLVAEHPDRGPAEGKGELGGQVGVGQTTNPVGPEQRSHRQAPVDGQRLEYWGALRAFLSPYFLRSTSRASRVRKPRFFSSGRSSTSRSTRAREMAWRRAPAWPETPPPSRLASTS